MKVSSGPRERILKKAYELFYTQGYHVTGINQILEEANVAKASLYQHFGSKEELGVEYIKKVREDWFQAFHTFLSKTTDPGQKVLACFDFLIYNMKLNNFRGCRFLNLLTEIDDSNSAMREQIIEHKAKLRNTFRSMVSELNASCEKSLVRNIADATYLLFEAAIIESKLYKDVWPIQTARKTVNVLLTTPT